MSLPSRLLGANPSIQVSSLLSGSLSTPSAKGAYVEYEGAELLSTQSVSGVNTITFSNLNTYSDYDHLEFHCALSSTSNAYTRMRFNSDTSSIYTAKGTLATVNSVTSNDFPEASVSNMAPLTRNADQANSGTYINVLVPYFNSTTRKNYLCYGGGFALTAYESYVEIFGGQWGSTSAITSITIYMSTGSWATGSKISMYGWKNT